MSDPWTFAGESPSLRPLGGMVTLVEGSSFCVCAPSGVIVPELPHGVFFSDTRFLSHYELLVDGHRPEPLAAEAPEPFRGVFVSRARAASGPRDCPLVIFRTRYVGRGMREDIVVHNYADVAQRTTIQISFDADFADVFSVKEGRAGQHRARGAEVDGGLVLRSANGTKRQSRLTATSEVRIDADDRRMLFEVDVPAQSEWRTCLLLTTFLDGEEVAPLYPCDRDVKRAQPAERFNKWRRSIPNIETPHDGLRRIVARSAEDLGALRIFDPEFPERPVIAAGAPWFMTLFGRDSLLTSWMALPVDPDLAIGVVQTLARFQGTTVDRDTDEQPGRILHEIRFGAAANLRLGGGQVYYGTADATPLFVMLVGELRRWGLARKEVDALMPHVDRALAWIERHGDRDGDGYVEYLRASDRGLANQGWKDSWDGVRYADGTVAEAPIALAEVQGYTYAAYLARARFADEAKDHQTAAHMRGKADRLRANFNRDFWLEDRGYFAMGLDADKRPIDALASNMGHCLWTGIVDRDKAASVAERLLSKEMFSGWGVRTYASSNRGFNPLSYHCGSVWPHDNAIIAAGLMRYGFVEEAQRIIMALLDAAAAQGDRLPELFSGLDRAEAPMVVSYPTSCSPQAWSAASPLLFLRTLLRFEPMVPSGKLWLAPEVPKDIGSMKITNVPLVGGRMSVEVRDGAVVDLVVPDGLEVIREPRDPLRAE